MRLSAVPSILFVCVENSSRSQMAEGFARFLGVPGLDCQSAGSAPSGIVNPRALEMMRERGIDLAAQRSKSLDEFKRHRFDAIVTMGCGDACPWLPANLHLDWGLPDPKHLSDGEFRVVRDDIERRVCALLVELGAKA